MGSELSQAKDSREALLDDLRETAPRMHHVLTTDPDLYLCGTRRPTHGPPKGWGLHGVDCVVCANLWLSLPLHAQNAIVDFWLRASERSEGR